MEFVEVVAVIRRHKSLVIRGLAVAIFVTVFSSYRLESSGLVSRSRPAYETSAVVAIKPGAAIPLLPAEPSVDGATPATTLAPAPSVPVDTSVTTTTSTTPTTSVATLDNVIDSRGLYYAAESIQTAVESPGFAEKVRAVFPTMDGSIFAVVPLDTNTIRLVVDGSTPTRAAATMHAALSELQPMVNSYATSRAFRFTLDTEVVSGPSTPASVPSIKGPLTTMIVFSVGIVSLWTCVRVVDLLQLHRLQSQRLEPAEEMLESSRRGPHVDEDLSGASPQ